jgi:hypothetical protein
MKKTLFILMAIMPVTFALSQTNMSISNPEAEAVILGNYDPSVYIPGTIINHVDSILHGVVNNVSGDTMINWLQHIDSFHNRNTGSDTVSQTNGIGAVRRWLYSKFNQISEANQNRLLVSYMDFDASICGMSHHKNVFGVLPGLDTTKKEIIFIEGHFDTRCEGACDTACYSPGMDDNGSGTVLVLELARVMSRYAFDHTVIFALPTGEDQGLYGGRAFANYFHNQNVEIRACLNNDVIGGIACGMTSSPPSCPYFNHIDSTNVRIFSYSFPNDSSRNSKHKQLARYIQLHQEEDINPLLETPMQINIILREDRQGRSGDHIPFRQRGYTSIRFCSQNEHGDGSGTPPDRQHTTTDVLGLDLTIPPDGILDTFFVDPGYLRRNAVMNGVNLGYLAMAPNRPDPEFAPLPDGFIFQMTGNDTVYQNYRVAVRSLETGTLNWDTLYNFTGTSTLEVTGLDPDKEYFVSVMNVQNGFEGLASIEYTHLIVGIGHTHMINNIYMLQTIPNPFSDETCITVQVGDEWINAAAEILIRDLTGKKVKSVSVVLDQSKKTILIKNDSGMKGVYTCTLLVNGQSVQTRKLIAL